jgi:predicted heme/steroid binding protein
MGKINIRSFIVGLFLLCSYILSAPYLAGATEEFAKQTGHACSYCHLDPGGGGELTVAGKAYAATRQDSTTQSQPGLPTKLFRLVIGYLHFLTAIFWFGTILYVHLVLKPAYAAGGLPRGELRVGIISMLVIGTTGAILTWYRVTSVDMLIHTRFGILLVVKICLYLTMVLSALFVITVIGPRLKAKRKDPTVTNITGDLTQEELAACDGKDGRPAYFAFEGKIYDATQSKLWKNGVHMGRHQAGSNLTEALQQAPHGADKVTTMAAVGNLVVTGPRKTPLHERVFYFMAYMNLVMVFSIVLILSLWRWG